MHTFYITDLPKEQAKTETFLNGTVSVVSHSGLHPTEALLIQHLSRFTAAPSTLLIAGNRTGAVALAAMAQFPGCAITCHTFDVHHARAILRNLATNSQAATFLHDPFVTPPADLCAPASDAQPPFTVACTEQIPPNAYAATLFMATSGTMTGELIIDQLEDIQRNLAPGGICVIACEAESRPLIKQIKAIFGNLSVKLDSQGLLCATAVKKEALKRVRDFSSVFLASLEGTELISLCSLPGVFCHRRPDKGGLALAEIAARELRPGPGQRVLDMGCGCGLVGILLAQIQPETRVTFIDSHARACASTHRNLESLGLHDHPLLLSDTGTPQTDFDLFAGNPPYYSDFKIATLFINTAYATLHPGGVSLLVAKSPQRLEETLQETFGNAEVLPRRGYGVVRSLR